MENARLLGPLSIVLLAIGLTFIPLYWRHDFHTTFSQHVAKQRWSIIYYIALFSVTLPLFFLFVAEWALPYYHLTLFFGGSIFLAAIFQLGCTLVIEKGQRRTFYHRLLAGASALCLVPPIAILTLTQSIPAKIRLLAFVSNVIMLAIISVVVLKKGKPRYFLLLQIAYFTAFFVPMLLLAFT